MNVIEGMKCMCVAWSTVFGIVECAQGFYGNNKWIIDNLAVNCVEMKSRYQFMGIL